MSAHSRLKVRLEKFKAALRRDDTNVLEAAAYACRMEAYALIEEVRRKEQKRRKELRPDLYDEPA